MTEHKPSERSVDQTDQLYRLLAEHFPNGAVLVVDEDLRYLLADGKGLEAAGLTSEDFVGNHVSDVFEEPLSDTLVEIYEATLEGETFSGEISFGDVIYQVETVPIPDETGEFHTGMVMTQDVTERKEREREIQRQNDQLEEFASVVSHDLRNPLGVAQGRLQLAIEDRDWEELDAVSRALDRMETLINDMLSLANAGEAVGDAEPVELAELAEACWRNVETETATLHAETEVKIQADKSRLQQLLENLLRNAVEHGEGDVTITISDLPNGFYVEDDGPGIPSDDRDHVLDSGYSTKEDGRGFGLSIVRDIADAHGWDVWVTEGTGGGARFEFTQ